MIFVFVSPKEIRIKIDDDILLQMSENLINEDGSSREKLRNNTNSSVLLCSISRSQLHNEIIVASVPS